MEELDTDSDEDEDEKERRMPVYMCKWKKVGSGLGQSKRRGGHLSECKKFYSVFRNGKK